MKKRLNANRHVVFETLAGHELTWDFQHLASLHYCHYIANILKLEWICASPEPE